MVKKKVYLDVLFHLADVFIRTTSVWMAPVGIETLTMAVLAANPMSAAWTSIV